MKSLQKHLFTQNLYQFVIPAQAGIQVGDMSSLVLLCLDRKNIRFAVLSLKVSMSKLLVDWIPAYTGMTGLGRVEVVYEA